MSGDNGLPAQRSRWRRYAVYPLLLVGTLLLAGAVRACLFHTYRIQSSSMEGTLLRGDYVLADRLTYGPAIGWPGTGDVLVRLPGVRGPERGEIVIFRSPDGGPEYIKRCVALAGDTVLVRDNRVTVNGQPFREILQARFGDDTSSVHRIMPSRERAVRRFSPLRIGQFGPHRVADGHIFLMGDNRANSRDSRLIGDIPLTSLRGRALAVYWSSEPDSSWLKGVRWGRIGISLH